MPAPICMLAGIPAGFWWGVLGGLIPGVLATLVQHALERRAEQKRRQPGLAVRLVTKDVWISLSDATVTTDAGDVGVYAGGARVSPEPTPRAPVPTRAAQPQVAAHRRVYHALVRNLSERPAAIIDVTFLRANGDEIQFAKREYVGRLGIPIVLGSWDVKRLELEVGREELPDAEFVVLRDMDEKQIRVSLSDEAAWRRWITYR